MSVQNFQELSYHYGHEIVVALYGQDNVTLECNDCHEVLLDFDEESHD
jgi:hypothetical protein